MQPEAYEAVQSVSDLLNFRLQNDDVQDFDTRWDPALAAASEIPTEMAVEGSYKSKLQTREYRNNEQPSSSRLKTPVRRHVDQTTRTRNFRAQNEIVEMMSSNQESKKKENSTWKSVFQWKTTGQCSKGDYCSFRHNPTSGNKWEGTDLRENTLEKSYSRSAGTN